MEEAREDHGEKKSVLKKVKDKAKKIKETLAKHDHNNHHSDTDPTSDDEEAGEEHAPEIHGAPVYESTVIRSTDLPMQLPPPQDNPKLAPSVQTPVLQRETAPTGHGSVSGFGDPGAQGTRVPSSYEAEAVDPTKQGGEEAEVPPLARRLGDLSVEEDKHEAEVEPGGYTGSHDQFSPEQQEAKFSGHTAISAGGASGKDNHPIAAAIVPHSATHHETADIQSSQSATEDLSAPGAGVPSNYETKAVDPTIQGGREADVSPLAQRLDDLKVEEDGHGAGMETGSYTGSHDQFSPEPEERKDSVSGGSSVSEKAEEDESRNTLLPGSYGHKVIEKLAPVYQKVAATVGAGAEGKPVGGNEGLSVKEYLAEKLKPGDEDKALSDTIAEALYKKKEQPPLAEVTESPEVAANLGTGKEGKLEGTEAVAAGKESSGGGFVDRLKDAASLWLGKSNATDTVQESLKKSYVSGGGSTEAESKR